MRFKLLILFYLSLFSFRADHKKSPRDLKRIQHKRFKRLIRYLWKSPYYKRFITEDNLLGNFPIIDKGVFMGEFDRINTRGITLDKALTLANVAEESRDFSNKINGVTIGLSTGTSGNRAVFMADHRERAKWAAAVIHRVIGFQLKKRKIAFFLRANSSLYESVNSSLLQFNFFDLLTSHDENFRRLVALDADILVAQPSALRMLANSYTKTGITPNYSKVISVAEVLDRADRAYIENVFMIALDEVYQCTEGFLASTCNKGKIHLNEDFLIIEKEYIDSEKRRYYPIITDLYRKTQPVIRYRLEDILVEGIGCECGSHFSVIDQIEGRKDDIIQLRNKKGEVTDIFPDFFRRAISSASVEIKEYSLTQIDKDKLEISIVTTTDNSNDYIRSLVEEKINMLLSKFDIYRTQLIFTEPHQLDPGVKQRRIRNEYHEKA